MAESELSTIYIEPGQTWETVGRLTKLGRAKLRDLNPHVRQLEKLEPGIPIDVPLAAKIHIRSQLAASRQKRKQSPYDIAKVELLMNIAEIPGKQHNPRIVLYHSTTTGGAAPDEVPWCSSFVNYCVEQAGLTGTNSKAARSWLDWGVEVDAGDWDEGDVIVFWRESPTSWKGHVGFLVAWDGSRPMVLGGNQNNRLCIDDPYPFSRILSVRRAK